MTDEQIAFNRSIPDEKIRKAFEARERRLDDKRGYNDSRLPPFDLNWNGTMYASPWVREKFNDYCGGYCDAAWDAHRAALAQVQP